MNGKTQTEEENEEMENHNQIKQRESKERLERDKKVMNERPVMQSENGQRRGIEKDRQKDEEELINILYEQFLLINVFLLN